ncbi:MAG: hypothetical protein NXI31_11250 [bacterium]|nr:hypothetical protein [bacterium]
MKKLTIAGLLLAAVGVGVAATGFTLMAVSGEVAFETKIPKTKGKGAMHTKTYEVELAPAMNPLGIDLATADASSGATVTLTDAAGNEVYGATRSGSIDSTGGGSWWFTPVTVESAGKHELTVRLWSRGDGAVGIRRNITQFPIVVMFAAVLACVAGIGLVVIPSVLAAFRGAARAA